MEEFKIKCGGCGKMTDIWTDILITDVETQPYCDRCLTSVELNLKDNELSEVIRWEDGEPIYSD